MLLTICPVCYILIRLDHFTNTKGGHNLAGETKEDCGLPQPGAAVEVHNDGGGHHFLCMGIFHHPATQAPRAGPPNAEPVRTAPAPPYTPIDPASDSSSLFNPRDATQSPAR